LLTEKNRCETFLPYIKKGQSGSYTQQQSRLQHPTIQKKTGGKTRGAASNQEDGTN